MKQLPLTKEQRALLNKMNDLFNEARAKNIGFIYEYVSDLYDGNLIAFNSTNVQDTYVGNHMEDENDMKVDFNECYYVNSAYIDNVNGVQNYYLKFEQ